jgi:threonine/homoserine/homoserine lactone efflux protein
MSIDLFIALVGYAFVSSVTPGPNNMMLLASGVNFGFRRSVPHMLGVSIGFVLMVFVIGLGAGAVFTAYPDLYRALRYILAAFMLWLAWKIANAGPLGEGKSGGKPMTFLGAAAFQWVNPKAWIMALGAAATYGIAGRPLLSATLLASSFALVNLPSVSVWTLFGTALRRFLSDPRWLRAFNWTMAGLLVLSLAPVLYT